MTIDDRYARTQAYSTKCAARRARKARRRASRIAIAGHILRTAAIIVVVAVAVLTCTIRMGGAICQIKDTGGSN